MSILCGAASARAVVVANLQEKRAYCSQRPKGHARQDGEWRLERSRSAANFLARRKFRAGCDISADPRATGSVLGRRRSSDGFVTLRRAQAVPWRRRKAVGARRKGEGCGQDDRQRCEDARHRPIDLSLHLGLALSLRRRNGWTSWRQHGRGERHIVYCKPRRGLGQSPSVAWISVSAATAAVSARNTLGPRLSRMTPGTARIAERSSSSNPPSGPIIRPTPSLVVALRTARAGSPEAPLRRRRRAAFRLAIRRAPARAVLAAPPRASRSRRIVRRPRWRWPRDDRY